MSSKGVMVCHELLSYNSYPEYFEPSDWIGRLMTRSHRSSITFNQFTFNRYYFETVTDTVVRTRANIVITPGHLQVSSCQEHIIYPPVVFNWPTFNTVFTAVVLRLVEFASGTPESSFHFKYFRC